MDKAILSEVRRCRNTTLSASGFSVSQMAFGSNSPVDSFGWDGGEEDLTFAEDIPLAGQFVQQWKLRVRAQEATMREIARSKLRRLLAHSKTFNCEEIDVRVMAPSYKARNRKTLLGGEAPRRFRRSMIRP